MRFSTVNGSRGSADTVRDPRGKAVRLYTDEGNWDIGEYQREPHEPQRAPLTAR